MDSAQFLQGKGADNVLLQTHFSFVFGCVDLIRYWSAGSRSRSFGVEQSAYNGRFSIESESTPANISTSIRGLIDVGHGGRYDVDLRG